MRSPSNRHHIRPTSAPDLPISRRVVLCHRSRGREGRGSGNRYALRTGRSWLGHQCDRQQRPAADRRFRRKQVRLGGVRSAVSNVRGHGKLAVGSFKQTERSWDALEMMFVAVGKRDAGTGDKIDDGTRHEHFAGLR
jgi:hypothetical protein